MVEVVGVRFRDAGHIYYYAPGKNEYFYNDKVLVESQQAHQIATVAIPKIEIEKKDLSDDLKTILHKASDKELKKVAQNEAVSIKMAKDQGLSLNPTKISGLCGRLMCCLKYENGEYEAAKKEMPDYGKEINTPEGRGKVIGLNLLSKVVKVRLFGRDATIDFDYQELVEAGDLS